MNEHKLLVEKKLTSKEVFKGKLLHVFYDEAKLPDGGVSSREWIKHPGACAVVPVFKNGDLMMIRQFRYPMSQIFWEVPAGKIDFGETEDQTALRELQEEAGVKTGDFAYIGHFYPCIGYSDEVIHIYVAWNLAQTAQKVDEDEFVTKERIPFKEAVKMVHSGEINDGKTVICLLRAWKWWQGEGPFKLTK
ncbi:MAG: NUDIX hydrolase [Gracilimonas sp.]|uniref:NUDIX domain-containing protein n=1 Tax=Gracilimonas sp. TaxID=1974203 RepID=UPI0019870BA8|nr:NUDIX hydrolase [Gracilimonas sp.]MBD3617120.1 NUDIX hydrolase [Gracilimonas sp.]